MSSTTQQPASTPSSHGSDRVASTALRWRVWPIRDDRGAVVLIATAALAGALLAQWTTGSVWVALLVVGLLVLSAWRAFLPADIAFDARGIDYRVLGRRRRIPWHAIARCEVLDRGIVLLPADDSGPLDYLGGLYLPWRDHRDEVLAWLTRCLPPERLH